MPQVKKAIAPKASASAVRASTTAKATASAPNNDRPGAATARERPVPAGAPTRPAARKEATLQRAPIQAVLTGVEPMKGQARLTKRALKERYQIEQNVHSTPSVLYEMISTPSGFSKWFCDDVNVRGEEFTFLWGNEQQTAVIVGHKQGELMRFHWTDDDDEGSFFELRIRVDAITNEVALLVTDHAWPAEVPAARQLWESQIAHLLRVLGS